MRFWLYITLLVAYFTPHAMTQVDVEQALKARYSFDACDATDDTGNNSNGEIEGAQCQCGVQGESLFFDGVDDYIQFQGNINEYFKANNFTISFYFKPSTSSPNTVLLSKYESCSDETGLIIRYGHGGNIAVTLKGLSGVENRLHATLKSESCWIHLALVRRGSAIELYENGELIGTHDNNVRNTDITSSSPLTLGKGLCSTSLDKPFRGNIDELAIYNQPLTALQIQRLLIPVDQISTPDTVVAIGDKFFPALTHTCAPNVNWSPSSVFSPSGEVTLNESTTLIAEFNHGNCIAIDSIRVRVVNSDEIECADIPMPRAFTPNGDGLNDSYFITLPGAIDQLIAFEIYNTWNERIFYSNDPQAAWDGTFDGKILNPGGFLYKIRYTCMGREYVITGEFLLLN